MNIPKKKTIIHSIKMDIYKCPFFSFAYQLFFRCKINNKLFEYKESTFLVLKE
jgi:hypothetical protein